MEDQLQKVTLINNLLHHGALGIGGVGVAESQCRGCYACMLIAPWLACNSQK